MKKFSNITNQKVGVEPKVDHKVDEATSIKYRMIDLMDKLLSVTTYGPIINYDVAGTIKIAGKEMLAEAIADMLADISTKDKTVLLESLKSEVRDWDVLDNKIESLVKERSSLNNKSKMIKLLEMYGDDEEMLITLVEAKSLKITNKKTLTDYNLLITENKSLSAETKTKLAEIYSERIKQIESGE
jgi:hypothetical protein